MVFILFFRWLQHQSRVVYLKSLRWKEVSNLIFHFTVTLLLDLGRINELITHLQKNGELVSPKLAKFQEVINSKFFNAVKEVYENVYRSTADLDASPDVSTVIILLKFIFLVNCKRCRQSNCRCLCRRRRFCSSSSC